MSHLSGFVKAGVAALSLTMMVACAPGQSVDEGNSGATEDQDTTINYMYFSDGPDEQATRDLIAKFEEQTGATVNLEIVPFGNLEQTLQARLSGGNAPDVARLDKLAAYQNDLLDLGQYSDKFDGVFHEGMDSISVIDGTRVSVPNDLTINGPIVNVDMFKKAGVEVPTADNGWKSWSELVEAAKKVQEANDSEYAVAVDISGNRFSTLFSEYGTTSISPSGENNWDAAKLEKALTDIKGWHDDGTMPKDLFLQAGSKYKAANEIFLAGQVPVYVSGNWQVAAFAKDANFEWAVVPNACEERCGGFPGGKFLAAFKESKNPNLATQFIEFMSEPEQQKYMAEKANFIPTRKDLLEGDVSYAERQADMEVFQAEVTRTPDDAYSSAFSAAFPGIGKVIIDQMAQMLADKQDPAATADGIIKGTDEAIDDVK